MSYVVLITLLQQKVTYFRSHPGPAEHQRTGQKQKREDAISESLLNDLNETEKLLSRTEL